MWQAAVPLLLGATIGAGLVTIARPILGGATVDEFSLTLAGGVVLAGLVLGAVALAIFAARAGRARRTALLLAAADDALPDARLVVDARGEVRAANLALRTLLGDEEPPSLARLRAWLCRDGDAVAVFTEVARAASDEGGARREILHVDMHGRSRCFDLSAHALLGEPGWVVWTLHDVTERRSLFDTMRAEQRKLADFLDSAPLGFYSVDADGRFLYVNAGLATLLGVAASDLVDGNWRLHDFLIEPPPSGTPAHTPFVGPVPTDQGDAVVRGAGGRPVQVNITQSVVPGEVPGTLMTRSVVRDLSREREYEQALRASELRFQRFFEEAPVGVALLDHELRISEANPTFAALIGRERSELGRMPFVDLVRAAERMDLAAKLAAAASGRNAGTPIEVPLAGGGERAWAIYARPLESGPATGLMLHLVETTHQKRLEVQFAQSQKMLAVGQLAGGIAHDFNNLLTAMIGFCDLLLLRHQPGDASFADIMQIKQNANRAANLVRQLLAFSRQQTLQPRVLNLTDTLAELSNLLRRLIGAGIDLSMQHGRNLGLVRVDQIQLEQVIMNLAVNGRDAMPNGGVLTIRTSNASFATDKVVGRETILAGDYVLIEVIDTGMGIPKENLDRIFEPFFSTKEVGTGTGLGLSTVYGIVKQTDGYVFVESEPGKGAHFSIYLPQYKGEATVAGPARADATAADLTGNGTVLLVEDEDPVRLFSARALRNKGYKVLEARSGDMALQVLESSPEPVDVVVTDVVMPRMDGPTLIGKLREQRPDIRIICISGYAEGAFRQKLETFTDIHFLPKPFSLQQLASKVKDVLSAGR
ncbi:MAG: PAS domain-containing protein [Alphaproteobacteria bacterium]